MKDLWKAVEHNRFAFGVPMVLLVMALAVTSCEPRANSIMEPGETVSAAELQIEVVQVEADFEAKMQAADIGAAEIERKRLKRAKIIGVIGGVATAAAQGAVNPATGIAAGIQLLTLGIAGGVVADNRRKDKIIKAKTAKKA